MRALKNWAICCPGPSLALCETRERIKREVFDCIVAVNGAISLDFKFDYWIVQDIEVFETVAKTFTKADSMKLARATLLIPDRWLENIPSCYPWVNGLFEHLNKETFPADSVEEFAQTMPSWPQINWRKYTLLMAIACAIKRGAEIIRIYGADWQGRGYCTSGFENERTIHTSERWVDEIKIYKEIRQECLKHNIQVIREEG